MNHSLQHFLLVVFHSVLLQNCFAQDKVCSDEFRSSREMSGLNIIGNNDQNFFAATENRKENYVQLSAFSLIDLKEAWNVQLPLEAGETFESIHFYKNRFMLFTGKFHEEKEQIHIFCTLLDALGTKQSDPSLVHFTLSESKNNAPEFGVEFSPDSTKMLLFFDPPFERKSSEALSFKCYSLNLALLWEKDMLLPYTQEIVQVHSFLLDNAGDLYMMSGRNPLKNGRQWQKPQGARYVVFYYNAINNKLKEYDISLKSKQVMSVIFSLNKNQDVIITGYYSNDFHFSAAGTLLFVIGAHGAAVKSAAFMPFGSSFLENFMDKRDVEQYPTLPDFYLDYMIMNHDGQILLVGEQYYVSQNTITDPTTGRQTIEYRYNFDDIIVTALDSTGKHIWNKKIPKRQFTTSDSGGCSYLCFSSNDSLKIFFNDNTENQERLSSDPNESAYLWSGGKNSVSTQVIVDTNGNQTRSVLVNNKDQGAVLKANFDHVDPHRPQVLSYMDGKNYKFCLVK